MAGGLIYTTGDKPTDRHTIIPSRDNSVYIGGRGGKPSAEQTLPIPVQENIDIENVRISDSTVNNSTEGKHGLLPKLSGDNSTFLNGEGEFVSPPRTGSGFGNIWNVESGQTVTIGANYENVVSEMEVSGVLDIYGKLTIL